MKHNCGLERTHISVERPDKNCGWGHNKLTRLDVYRRLLLLVSRERAKAKRMPSRQCLETRKVSWLSATLLLCLNIVYKINYNHSSKLKWYREPISNDIKRTRLALHLHVMGHWDMYWRTKSRQDDVNRTVLQPDKYEEQQPLNPESKIFVQT